MEVKAPSPPNERDPDHANIDALKLAWHQGLPILHDMTGYLRCPPSSHAWHERLYAKLPYFDSLTQHAVPLDERAISALAHSAMGLDVYSWLGQRLHRIETGKPQFIAWKSLKEQFGWNYKRMVDFRRAFRDILSKVHSQYPAARLEMDQHGVTLRHSPPPIQERRVPLNPGVE